MKHRRIRLLASVVMAMASATALTPEVAMAETICQCTPISGLCNCCSWNGDEFEGCGIVGACSLPPCREEPQ